MDLEIQRRDALWRDKKHWKFFYAIYFCADDPRILVPKITPWGVPKKWFGLTWNFAHPVAIPSLLFTVVATVGPSLLLTFYTSNVVAIIATFVLTVWIALEIGWRYATG